MARDLDVPVKVVGCPTVRDKAGLASLQPKRLPVSRRTGRRASVGPLFARRRASVKIRSVARRRRGGRPGLFWGASAPLAIQYLDVVDPVDPRSDPRPDGPWLVAAAVYVGRTRA
jgi:pantoate--beta-alanine ligase